MDRRRPEARSETKGENSVSKVYTITECLGDYNDWNGPNGTVRYFNFDFTDDAGGAGKGSFGRLFKDGQPPQAPTVGYKFVAEASYDGTHDNWKFKKVQTPEQAAAGPPPSGRGGGGGGGNKNDPARQKAITYQHAQKVAATIVNPHENWEGFVALAEKIAKDVDRYAGTGQPPAAMPEGHGTGYDENDLQAAKQQLQSMANAKSYPLTLIGQAIQEVCGHPQLEVGDIDKMDAILAKADELHIPF